MKKADAKVLTSEAQSLEDLLFEDVELPEADLSGKEFLGCTFRRAKLQESRWRRARLEDCRFEDCDLTRMNPLEMRAIQVSFERSKLMGIDWSSLSSNPLFSFEECDLRYASFVGTNLRKCSLLKCNAVEASFIDCDLTEADFSGSNLAGANFESSTLEDANLATAESAFVNPTKNRVAGVFISQESAVLLATSFRMRVSGYSSEPAESSRSKRTKRR